MPPPGVLSFYNFISRRRAACASRCATRLGSAFKIWWRSVDIPALNRFEQLGMGARNLLKPGVAGVILDDGDAKLGVIVW